MDRPCQRPRPRPVHKHGTRRLALQHPLEQTSSLVGPTFFGLVQRLPYARPGFLSGSGDFVPIPHITEQM